MIYATGDTHGNFQRFAPEHFPEQAGMTKEDYMLICGDFGGVWDRGKKEERNLDWLEDLPFTTLFISGNHENFDQLSRYPVKEWAGGRVHELRPNLYHLLRGEIFTIEGKTFFAFGGAKSTDKSQRWPGVSWWPQEQASEANFDNAAKNLTVHDFTVDYVRDDSVAALMYKDVVPVGK